ncbi:MAG: hypothetical protein BWY84_00196 [Candidatus Aerophobetes bacterium ADurb.Bin490]|nr:MAG: hypothetical protein BWY84_00196 [Candidatus Aerophobetes bacterium ADurb.Bin490]
MESDNARSTIIFIVNPEAFIKKNAPKSELGRAIAVIMVERKLPRKSQTIIMAHSAPRPMSS